MKCKKILVKGIVQGVGFRPFVYNLALENNLNGNVKNTCDGVYINIEGKKESINNFLYNLKKRHPKLAKIEEVIIESKEIKNYKNFEIINSDIDENGITIISPDIAICNDCIEDINNPNDKKRYKYPFTNCTNCGPRFSIIKKLPYDRNKTSMKKFKMCKACDKEYQNPIDRRFHAQPTCCKECGPNLTLLDSKGKAMIPRGKLKDQTEFALKKVKDLLKDGKIIAIKGLGGFHLVCNARDYKAIDTLRERKNRKSKPLALMMRDIDTVSKYCKINNKEKEILLGNKKPILILNKKTNNLPKNISYKNHTFGVMLPYTPLHILLFDNDLDILIMTSANISNLPIIYKNEDALDSLKNIADYFLLHDRDINVPIDDSIVKVVMNEARLIRTGRGYSPMTFKKNTTNILALGSELKNTFSVSKDSNIFISQYMGNMDSIQALDNYKMNVNHLKQLYDIKINSIVYDNHPSFWHKDYINEFNCEKIGVYHHHAHIASCMFENDIDDKVIGLAFDGSGYGEDNNIWGGEFLICDYKSFKRVGQLKYMQMPGGDNATKEPWKMAISLINQLNLKDFNFNILNHMKDKDYKFILSMLNNNINCTLTSSMGRLFDGVSAILGFKNRITFEGEACIEIENLAKQSVYTKEYYNFEIQHINEMFIINTDSIINEILQDIQSHVSKSVISMKFHNTVVEFSYIICNKLRELYNINKVALSGGVFQNDIILVNLYKKLRDQKFEVLTHKLLPCNDSSISIGQLIVAKNRGEDNVCSYSR
ncbi:carbamoyltransferase HypF [Paraclostridium ghonii]|uniref:Carbamoyltransferase n=1 Tax=Paraclostridium ghonii TaxID=29358 RepID=A0ABU0N3F5_9FIRM|nr:carbamoyltransferase HypF [Paeniclostridium ghonii]MDQ0557363.1 hydrogenase maturation protein HypF [Paeniclostridium ghonii]